MIEKGEKITQGEIICECCEESIYMYFNTTSGQKINEFQLGPLHHHYIK